MDAGLQLAQLSRRDLRTKPAVLTPGRELKRTRPEGATELDAPLYAVDQESSVTNIFRPYRAATMDVFLGLRPQA